MIATESQSRNYNPENVNKNFEDMFEALANQKLEEEECKNSLKISLTFLDENFMEGNTGRRSYDKQARSKESSLLDTN